MKLLNEATDQKFTLHTLIHTVHSDRGEFTFLIIKYTLPLLLYSLHSSAVDIGIDLIAGLGVTFLKLVTFDLDNQAEKTERLHGCG